MKTAVAKNPRIMTPPVEAAGPVTRRQLSPGAVILAAVALGGAVQVNYGQYHPLALLWLTVGLVACVAGIAAPRNRLLRKLDTRPGTLLGLALAVQLILLLTRSPGATGSLAAAESPWLFKAGVAAGVTFACAAAAAAAANRRRSAVLLVAMLLTHAAAGAWVLHAAPNPGIDVGTFQRDGADALLRGDNPYSITFVNPYPDPSRFYGPGAEREGRLLFGYPYPPLSLLMALPGHLLGDFRYAQLVATSLAGALVAFARRGSTWSIAAAAVLLFTPRGFFVLEAGWTEPFAVLLLAATVFAACRRQSAAWLPLGLLVAVKQYLVLALLLSPLLPTGLRSRTPALLWKALFVAAAVTVPFALWDLSAFIHSAVLLQSRQPFRDDALSYLVAVANLTGWRAPGWVALLAVGPAAWLALRKLPRTPAGFAAGLALVCLAFFAFNKQAFCNYYHFVIGALCCAAGAAHSDDSEASREAR